MNRIVFVEQFYYPEGWGGAELARDVTVALVTGEVQFVENRLLTARGRGERTLVLRRQGGSA